MGCVLMGLLIAVLFFILVGLAATGHVALAVTLFAVLCVAALVGSFS
jgi:hypothetical protein